MDAAYVPNLSVALNATERQPGGSASPRCSLVKKAKPLNPTLIKLFWILTPSSEEMQEYRGLSAMPPIWHHRAGPARPRVWETA